jgi:3',5'-nucleoside bisphosphate phosphatase
MILADFHIHSTFSDGSLTIPEIIDLYGSRGFGAIAITDHLCEEKSLLGVTAHWLGRSLTRENFPLYIKTIKEEAARAWKQYKMLVIPGFEITKNSLFNHRSAHVLAIGIEKYITADQDIMAAVREIRANGALAIAAHPVFTGDFEPQTYHLWNRRHEIQNEFDAWEVASGPTLFSEVLHSGLKMIASSDLHHAKQINSWKTKLDCEKNQAAIFEAIREQRLEFFFFEDQVRELSSLVAKSS